MSKPKLTIDDIVYVQMKVVAIQSDMMRGTIYTFRTQRLPFQPGGDEVTLAESQLSELTLTKNDLVGS